jgi:hypothetical protein
LGALDPARAILAHQSAQQSAVMIEHGTRPVCGWLGVAAAGGKSGKQASFSREVAAILCIGRWLGWASVNLPGDGE